MKKPRLTGIHGHYTVEPLKTACLIFSLLMAPLAFAQQIPPEVSPENNILLQSALADCNAKKYDAALEKLEALQKTIPNDPFLGNLFGAVYTKKKDYLTAQRYFHEVLAREPNSFPAQFNIGELLFLQRYYSEALDYFEKMQQQFPQNELLKFKVFLCKLQLGDQTAAAKVMNNMKYPGDTPAWYYAQAAWESHHGNKQKALKYITGAKHLFGQKTVLFDEAFGDLGIPLH